MVADTRLVKDFVVLPDLPQPKVNKHLIALVSKKLVTKNNNGVSCSFCDVSMARLRLQKLRRGPVDWSSGQLSMLCFACGRGPG